MCLAGQAASARATGYIQIVPVGASTYVYPVPLAQLPGDPAPDVDRTYTNITTPAGDRESVTVSDGYSLPLLFSDLAISPSSFTVAEVLGPNERSVLLTSAQATSTGTFADGPPVVWQDSQGAHFLIPSIGGGAAEAGETFVGQSETITINLHAGALLLVHGSSTARRVAVGRRVRFTGTVTGSLPGESLAYKWYFDDGTGSSRLSANHSYLLPGTYDVYLRATGSKDSLGFSALMPIQVGRAPRGPRRAGGGTNKNRAAPTHGAGAQGTGAAKPSAVAQHVNAGTGTGTSRPVATRAPAVAKAAPVRHRGARAAGPLLSGIALGGLPRPRASLRPAAEPQDRSPDAGVQRAARTGHLGHTGSSGDGPWIGLGALVALLGGAALERREREIDQTNELVVGGSGPEIR